MLEGMCLGVSWMSDFDIPQNSNRGNDKCWKDPPSEFSQILHEEIHLVV